MCSGDEESTLGFSDVDEELEEERYPQSLYTSDDMEVEECVGENDENEVSPDLLEVGEDVVVEEDEEVSRPTRVVKNTIDSDGEEAGDRPDDLASVDDDCLTLKTPLLSFHQCRLYNRLFKGISTSA